jgi:hypothetical protein
MDKHEIEKLRRKAMTRNQIRITLLSGFALVAALIASRPVAAQDAKQPYPNMAPIEQYLMDRDAEIALARSAAPDAISHDTSVIVLTRHGYETAVQGKTVGSAGSDADGWPCSTTPNFGIPKSAPQIVSIHPPPAPFSRTPTNAPNYSWPAIPNKKSSPQSKPQ